ncbi:polysaccharide biosynthesis/export family protein [Bradyrhizobium sp. LHD-71]|uniref:polysaccharide biosynthesis/export family protein n=1 Tax=Bradyrhizobium sp. LHD-71 TaxID=3072141 RepID=UPI00281009D4|nr:polysaccharide biosynthesis/export family protein [Bradyrhizobium sp. LHD-71]MDQ8732556.1 polysaccharide biosynthesis/export family protein [Bradyrhizobium sp. LHD-71]
MPTAGPSEIRVKTGSTTEGPEYGLVKLTPATLGVLGEFGPKVLSGYFPDRRPPQTIRFGIGDAVGVTIFEAAAGGLFIPSEAGVRPGNFVTLPNQHVDSSGNITVPYGGAIRALGRTPTQVQADIVASIQNRAIDPQAVVVLADQRTSLISVLGEVNVPTRLQANAAGERILDVITRAGGIRGQGFETWVTVERGGRRVTVPFGAIVYEPANNIWAHPDDTIYVYREPQVFLAFGAAGQQGQFPFDMWRINLAQAVAKAGGLLDSAAEPSSLFVYRREPRELAEKLGVDCSRFSGPTVPVIYNADLRDPAGYFLATKFQMQDRDIVFAANASTVETGKFLQFVRLIVATAADGAIAANQAHILKLNLRVP